MATNSLTEQYLNKFQARIAQPIDLIDFIDNLTTEETLYILRELTTHPETMPLIKFEGMQYLTTALVLKCRGIPMRKKSWFKRLFKR